MNTISMIERRLLIADPRTQARVDLDAEWVAHLRAILEEAKGDGQPAELEPMDIFSMGAARYWIADGHHRNHAYEQEGIPYVPCRVHKGGLREAILFACGANNKHGKQRSREDMARAVHILLTDPLVAPVGGGVWNQAQLCAIVKTSAATMSRIFHDRRETERAANPTKGRGKKAFTEKTKDKRRAKSKETKPSSVRDQLLEHAVAHGVDPRDAPKLVEKAFRSARKAMKDATALSLSGEEMLDWTRRHDAERANEIEARRHGGKKRRSA